MSSLFLRCLPVGMFQANCYLVAAAEHPGCIVIDPGGDADLILRALGKKRLDMILLTHSHCDHIDGAGDLLEAFPDAVLACHPACARQAVDPKLNLSLPIAGIPRTIPAPTRLIEDGETFEAGGLSFHAWHIPGHCDGSLVYGVAAEGIAFSGDTVFEGSIGRSDLPGGDGNALVSNLRRLLKELPPQTVIYPGHGGATTVKDELKHNPYL